MIEALSMLADFLPLIVFFVIKPLYSIAKYVKSINDKINSIFEDHERIIKIVNDHGRRIEIIEGAIPIP